eukprot:3672986-Prorocentrum_lima.AAC.1
MTSSLVGSEMCIRDRNKCAKGAQEAERGMSAFMCAENFVHDTTGGAWTVSYTHLTLPTICSV